MRYSVSSSWRKLSVCLERFRCSSLFNSALLCMTGGHISIYFIPSVSRCWYIHAPIPYFQTLCGYLWSPPALRGLQWIKLCQLNAYIVSTGLITASMVATPLQCMAQGSPYAVRSQYSSSPSIQRYISWRLVDSSVASTTAVELQFSKHCIRRISQRPFSSESFIDWLIAPYRAILTPCKWPIVMNTWMLIKQRC